MKPTQRGTWSAGRDASIQGSGCTTFADSSFRTGSPFDYDEVQFPTRI